jgi:hypothetical protein
MGGSLQTAVILEGTHKQGSVTVWKLKPRWFGAPLLQEDSCWRKELEFRWNDDDVDNEGDVCNLFTIASNKISDWKIISSATIC